MWGAPAMLRCPVVGVRHQASMLSPRRGQGAHLQRHVDVSLRRSLFCNPPPTPRERERPHLKRHVTVPLRRRLAVQSRDVVGALVVNDGVLIGPNAKHGEAVDHCEGSGARAGRAGSVNARARIFCFAPHPLAPGAFPSPKHGRAAIPVEVSAISPKAPSPTPHTERPLTRGPAVALKSRQVHDGPHLERAHVHRGVDVFQALVDARRVVQLRCAPSAGRMRASGGLVLAKPSRHDRCGRRTCSVSELKTQYPSTRTT